MNAPLLSVVIPSVNGWPDLERCLTALDQQRQQVELEVLIPERCGEAVQEHAARRFPWATLLPVPKNMSIPDMRALAFDHASAPSVAVIEDHVIVPEGWAAALLAARLGAEAIGGGVHNLATTRLVDWAAYLCEYSHMLPPLPVGESSWITGNNTIYARHLLEKYREATHAGRWEGHLHDALRADGIALHFRPEIMVGHEKYYTIGEYFSQRYLYARSYAGARAAESSPGRRLLYACVSPILFPVLLWRTVSRCFEKDVDKALVWRCLPLITLFVCAWSAGDIAGACFGSGNSLSRVR